MSNVIANIPTRLLIRKFHIEFTYTTRRNNKKIRTAEIKSTSREDAEFWFYRWIDEHNNKFDKKAYDNAKILSCVEIDREVIEI